MNNELVNVGYEDIKSLIYTIRGKQVMLDSDVARLYERETKAVNQTRKRNIKRFPEDFCFQLTTEEYKVLILQVECSRSQFVTLNKPSRGQNLKYLPYVYTEQGISMLSPLLNSEIAIEVSIKIMRAFVEMRKFNKEYPTLKIVKTNKFHDRFIIIDNKELYHCGASIKDLGKKCFAINRIIDSNIISKIIGYCI